MIGEEGEFVDAIEAEIAEDIAEEATDIADEVIDIAEEAEASIWGQASDVDWLAPAMTPAEYEDMLADADGENVDCLMDEDDYDEDVSELGLE